jgi:hypothetical protein
MGDQKLRSEGRDQSQEPGARRYGIRKLGEDEGGMAS